MAPRPWPAPPPPDPDSSLAPRALLLPYDPRWAVRGSALTYDLQAALGPLALRVDHIGSTAVPGMAAKPVLDLQVSVADLDAAAAAFDGPLRSRGLARWPYEHVDGYTDVKDPVVDPVAVVAEQWAAATGWHVGLDGAR